MWMFALAVLVPPIALACWSRVRTAALVTTIVLTGATAFIVSLVVIRDPSNLGSYAAFYLTFGPAFCIPVAMLSASAFARAPAPRLPFGALIGWALGIAAIFTADASAHAPTTLDPWLRILQISGPTIYCSCGAILATVRKRT